MEPQNDPNIFEFTLNVDSSMANALRRVMISNIHSVVISNVCIKENDSNLDDEMIAHRLGQIPLRIIDDSETPDNTDYSIELDITCNTTGPMTIYSRDIIFQKGIEVVDPDIPLVKLKKNECLKLFGNTNKGTGKEHAKYSVSCGTSYKKINDNLFHFHIESTGVYTAKEIFIKAIGILREDLLKYKK
jgi:DNA-directed RNA polymerase II subunit RPB3